MKNIFTLLLSFLLFFLTIGAPAAQVLSGTFAAGASHSLAIHDDGSLWATGDNARGQLGTGTATSQPTWVQVGSDTTWVRVAAGTRHSLALKANGTLWAWGDNTAGQLGTTSSTGFVATPTQVGTAVYTQLAAGNAHSLALRPDGTLWAWGDNFYGQLGSTANNASHTANPTPAQVPGTYTQLAAGYDFGLALRPDGTLWAWGRNTYGQLGNNTGIGTDAATPTPAQVGAAVYTQLAAGQYHSLALRADGSLYAWGNNFYGQLGSSANVGVNTANFAPTQVAGTYTRLAAGLGYSLALQATGSLYAWGDNAAGQLGAGSGAPSATPTLVPGTYVQLAAGAGHGLALQASGTLWAWGDNAAGQLGAGSASPALPAPTGTALPTRSTALGSSFGLAVRADGTLWAWGRNMEGQLGIGTATANRARPVQVGTDNDWVQVAAGTSFSLGLKANGTVWAWGLNNFGQLGNGTNLGSASVANPTPVQVGTGTYVFIAAGAFHSLALAANGSLWTWGGNQYGQLGNGTNSPTATATSPIPTQINGSYAQLAAGIYHSIALRADGSLYSWGGNDQGQLGINPNSGNLVNAPILVAAAGTYAALAAGFYHTLALAANGTLYTWGSNSEGQLGNGIRGANTSTANSVAGTYTKIAGGASHSLALGADGTLWAWGSNASGQLGRGNYAPTNSTIPTQEATRATNWVTLANSGTGNFSLARTPSGRTFASTGSNDNGQLGDGSGTNQTRFTRLIALSANTQPLPVQLVSFQARRTGAATVVLTWATATELANAGFGIERSVDGVSFGRLGFVAGAGSSRASRSYAFADKAALSAAYYRLAQTDLDGTVTFSPVQYVGAESDVATRLQLVPNPASGPVQALGLPTGASLALYDALGRLVRPAAASLNVAGLAAGVYVVRAQAPGQPVQSARLLVQ